jgi:hypothetical protein
MGVEVVKQLLSEIIAEALKPGTESACIDLRRLLSRRC